MRFVDDLPRDKLTTSSIFLACVKDCAVKTAEMVFLANIKINFSYYSAIYKCPSLKIKISSLGLYLLSQGSLNLDVTSVVKLQS